ncbi:MAG TPA: CusA/CzcA family heavy metal efflux RND transporter [Bryobacteraceae bacterium]|jgi:cobalt-zinc-cadmium resistance protein CzcA|nr:CusA/CzcA family heavy metal efflux RND transporter [Bryobacteraceae bacterium]
MIRAFVDYSLRNKLLVILMGLILLVWGAFSFKNLPVEAYPDVANNYVQVITQWAGRAGEEVEQQVTIPIEVQMNGIPHLSNVRSISEFGLSVVTMSFDDQSINDWNRQKVLERLSQVTLPANLQPTIGPDYSPVGQLYWYTLTSTNPKYDLMELKSLQDWVIVKQLKSVTDVVDVSSFGGITREYQAQVDPNKLISYGLSIGSLEQSLGNNNVNAGGSFIQTGLQQMNVREVGLYQTTHDIGSTVLKSQNGTPIFVRDISFVTQGPKIRLGQIGKAIHRPDKIIVDEPDVVEGIVLLRKGANGDAMLQALHEKVKDLNGHILPKGVKIVPFLDRSDLVHFTTHTVMHNLTEGILLVSIILFLFLGNLRSAFIVVLTIPFALLFASICLDLSKVPANLLSLGALDFGMVVDGSVVVVENIMRHISHRERGELTILEVIRQGVHEVQRPVFFARAIIITAYLPIFTLQHVEGRLFRPMALTVGYALIGSLIFSLSLLPVLALLLFGPNTKEWRNPLLEALIKGYRSSLEWAMSSLGRRLIVIGVAAGLLIAAVSLMVSGAIGSEFLPHLDEGAVWARGTLAPSTGPEQGERVMMQARRVFASFPEVTKVISQVGRPDDGTDAALFSNTEYFVDLKPKADWRPVFHEEKEELIRAMGREVDKIPGALWNFSQPIADNMEEAVSGVKGELAIKIFGTDLHTLEAKGNEILAVMQNIKGVQDLGMFRVIGQPNLNLTVDRLKAARYGINISDVQDAIQTAIGGNAVGQVLQGEERYDLVVRYLPEYRTTVDQIRNVRILAPSGERVSLEQLCNVQVSDGASQIYRENNSRYVALKYSVRGRDLGSTVEEAIQRVGRDVKLPSGYYLEWAGEYASAKRANARLAVIVPVTVAVIFFLLYSMFHSFKWAALAMISLALSPIGALFALYLTGTHFSVSSGIGTLALFGVAVETGVIMIEYINQLRARGYNVHEAAIEGAVLRLRPIMMTMLVATLGLLPAAISTGIGSDSQKPFAIVIVGGLSATLLLSIYVLPTVYTWVARDDDALPAYEPNLAEPA